MPFYNNYIPKEFLMKRLLTLTLALIMAVTLTACNAPAETEFTRAEDTIAETAAETAAAKTTTAANAAAVAAVADETAALSTNQEPSICGEYRSVLYSPYIETDEMIEEIKNSGEEHMLYDYVNITLLSDGSFQAAFMSEWIGRYDDYALFSSEALGTTDWLSVDSVTNESFNLGEVTVTADGSTAWVTFEGEEPQEYKKTVAKVSGETTAAETSAETTKQEHAICGLYRAVIPEHEGGDDYDYIRIDRLDDGSFQVEIMPVAGGTGNDYVTYETEELGLGSIQSFTFDPDIVPVPRSVNITADGNTAWVAYEGGEQVQYVKEE
jgi:type II secretory pathway component PulM